MHKILTLDNLYQFFVEQNKSINFSAKENGSPIVVSMPANFEVSENEISKDDMNLLKFMAAIIIDGSNGGINNTLKILASSSSID